MKMSKGFTLIELMIVVAIIGIISSMAIPAYQDYVARTQVHVVVAELGAYKTAVEERLSRGEDTDSFERGTLSEIGWTDSQLIDPKAMGRVPVDMYIRANRGSGYMMVIMGNNAAVNVVDTEVTWHRESHGLWWCEVIGYAPGWKDSYAPFTCEATNRGDGEGGGGCDYYC